LHKGVGGHMEIFQHVVQAW